jgi:hypothetical protein
VVFYYLQTLSNDEMTQLLGLEVVEFVPSTFSMQTAIDESPKRKEVFKVVETMPVRLATMHVCLPPSPSSQAMKAVLARTNGRLFRQIARFHVGTPSEVQKTMDEKHGLPHDLLPFMYDGKIKLKMHTKWINIRMTLDDMEQHDPDAYEKAVRGGYIIECPNNADVCGGKGQVIQSSPGNVAMRKLLESTIDEYNHAESRNDKSKIISRIVKEIQTSGGKKSRVPGKFLNQHESGLWYVQMTEKEALAKVSMAFRDVRKKIAAERKLQAWRQQKAKRGKESADPAYTVDEAENAYSFAGPAPSPESQPTPKEWPSLKRAEDDIHLPPRKRLKDAPSYEAKE